MNDKPYDVFLNYSSPDREFVRAVAERLTNEANLRVWFDEWSIPPGDPWQEALEYGLEHSASVVVFVGPQGIRPWQNEEMRSALETRTADPSFRVVPAILPGAQQPNKLPRFLRRLQWVEFASTADEDAFWGIQCGIAGRPRRRSRSDPGGSTTFRDEDRGLHFDLFLSYTHADQSQVGLLVEALEGKGLKVWWDQSDVEAFSRISDSVKQGLSRSKTLLAYFSKTYPTRRACQWELTNAFLSAQYMGPVADRVFVLNPESGVGHIPLTELRDALFLSPPKASTASDLEAIASEVHRAVTGLEGTFGDVRLSAPRWFGLKGVVSRRFVGRFTEMWKIHQALATGDSPLVTGARGGTVVQIRGMGGIGKTLLAEEYAHRFGAAYPGGIFWMQASGSQEIDLDRADPLAREAERDRQLRSIAQQLGLGVLPPEAAVEAVIANAVIAAAKPCLWVVDDLPHGLGHHEFRCWIFPHPIARTLITTRSREYDNIQDSSKALTSSIFGWIRIWRLIAVVRSISLSGRLGSLLPIMNDWRGEGRE